MNKKIEFGTKITEIEFWRNCVQTLMSMTAKEKCKSDESKSLAFSS